jgi:hypothetical protein
MGTASSMEGYGGMDSMQTSMTMSTDSAVSDCSSMTSMSDSCGMGSVVTTLTPDATSTVMDNYYTPMYGSGADGSIGSVMTTSTPDAMSTAMYTYSTPTYTYSTYTYSTPTPTYTYSTPMYGSGSSGGGNGGSGYQSCMQSEFVRTLASDYMLILLFSVCCILWRSYDGILYMVRSPRHDYCSGWFRLHTHRYCCSYSGRFALCSFRRQCICWRHRRICLECQQTHCYEVVRTGGKSVHEHRFRIHNLDTF